MLRLVGFEALEQERDAVLGLVVEYFWHLELLKYLSGLAEYSGIYFADGHAHILFVVVGGCPTGLNSSAGIVGNKTRSINLKYEPSLVYIKSEGFPYRDRIIVLMV